MIKDALKAQGRDVKDISWNGRLCYVLERGRLAEQFVGGRQDLAMYLHLFGEIPRQHLHFESLPYRPLVEVVL